MTVPTPLRRSAVRAAMKNDRFGDLRVLGIVTSTNDVAMRLVKDGAAPGLVVLADGQTAGRGRRGTPWISTPGSGLFATVVIPAPRGAEGPLVAGAAGIAAAAAVRAVAGVPAGVKWPNDLWVDDRKIGGILIEIPGGEGRAAFVGIGLTLVAPAAADGGAAPIAGILELAERPVRREALAAALLDHLDESLALVAVSPDEIRRRFRDFDVLAGREIVAETPEGTVSGTVAAVDLGDGIDIVSPDRTRRRLRPEHTHVVRVLPGKTRA